MNEAEWQRRSQRVNTRLRAFQRPRKIIRRRGGLDFVAPDCPAVEELPTANGPADHGPLVSESLLSCIETTYRNPDPPSP